MKTWLTALIGAIAGPLIAFPMLLILQPDADSPFFYVPTQLMKFLGRVFISSEDRFAGIAFAAPVFTLYFATIGICVALCGRHLCRRLHELSRAKAMP